ncbi:hypothetical protein N9M92_04750 [Flavobacteriaceae bacterium]|nr:hypothetical protein [Flavobacteriaceae bacterium]RPG63193.1 MAG: hypothetical protein CBC02_011630 [Flavobacteriaceae bacterium TMED42]MDA8763517.1 hypothetical protein [Flavobacteriaceae bacterium]MDB2315300.1 hypothetical protein [Flavobacteriaceae bacterium]MDC0478754.1 hypothetical protein [Flavobacteriaceae bacterium]|tara:strand:- start:1414 stop:1611 length:198 start_codon:yes stop_codon:yes gene_type:complete
MKIFIRILMALSLGMVVFNVTQVNWENPLSEKSSIAVIGIMAALCAFLLLLLLTLSKKISKKLNR